MQTKLYLFHIFYNLAFYPILLQWQITTQITFEIHLSLWPASRHPSTRFILLLTRTVAWLKTEILSIQPGPVWVPSEPQQSDTMPVLLLMLQQSISCSIFPWFVINDTQTHSLGPTTPLIPEGAFHIMLFLLMVPTLGACWKSQSNAVKRTSLSANIRNAILRFPN